MNKLIFWIITILFLPVLFLGVFWALASTYFYNGRLLATIELLGIVGQAQQKEEKDDQ